jgi:uncharacterized protein (TIGR00725 family)
MKKLQIAVIGSAGPEEYDFEKPAATMYKVAEQLGALLADNGCIVITGGKGGIMETASRGAKNKGGMTVGEISGDGRGAGNQFVDIEMVTLDIGFRGPSLLIGMSDAIISLGGGAGTLQEIAVAYRLKKPVILLQGYGGWTDRLASMEYLDERKLVKFVVAQDSKTAVAQAICAAKGNSYE